MSQTRSSLKLILLTSLASILLQSGGIKGDSDESATQTDPNDIYRSVKGQLDRDPNRISWSLKTLVGACKSLEGDCDADKLAVLDGLTRDVEEYKKYSGYKDYCYEQWMTRCDPQEALRLKITKNLSAEQQVDAGSFTAAVISAGEQGSKFDPDFMDLSYRYPKAIVDYMQSKEAAQLDAIPRKWIQKKRKFVEIFDRTILPLCKRVRFGLLSHLVALNKWIRDRSISDEVINPSTKSWLIRNKICGRILKDKESAQQYSYRYFIDK